MSLAEERVVLIGGAGFIGHKLALGLNAAGIHVEIIDGLQVNNLVSFTANVDGRTNRDLHLHIINERLRLLQEAGIPLHVMDARDYHALSNNLNLIQPSVIIHLAAVAHAGWANKNPYTTFDHSLRTLENALDCAREKPIHFIFFSSSMVYGNFTGGVVDETSTCDPVGIYGALKFGAEKLVIAYNQVFGLDYTIVRPSALYGEGCVSRRVSQVFIENALAGMSLEIRGDGSDRLDFTYIDDLSAGVQATIGNENARNQIFNLTFGQSRSIAELVDIIREYFPDVQVDQQPGDELMPVRGTLSIDKARSVLGYEPLFPLERGVPQYVGWYQKLFENEPRLFQT